MKYNELDIKQISQLKNKQTTREIEQILKHINDTIFVYNRTYITPKITNYIKEQLTISVSQLKELGNTKITEEQRKRITEIIDKCRDIYKQLNTITYSKDNSPLNQKYQISLFINKYKHSTDITELIQFLLSQSIYTSDNNHNNNQNYITMISELKTHIKKLVDNIAL